MAATVFVPHPPQEDGQTSEPRKDRGNTEIQELDEDGTRPNAQSQHPSFEERRR